MTTAFRNFRRPRTGVQRQSWAVARAREIDSPNITEISQPAFQPVVGPSYTYLEELGKSGR